jgi:type VI secretion system protein ImpA
VLQPDQTTWEQPADGAEPVPGAPVTAAPSGADLRAIDPAVAALSAPLSDADPCGPDLDMDGDLDYLNFFAQVEGVLPASFFSAEDGKPFDRTTVDIPGQRELVRPLLQRTRDLRLLIMQARLEILDKDIAAFSVSVAGIAELLEAHWDQVHPRCQGDDTTARSIAIAALDASTVVFPLQYAPLFEARRIGSVTYRALMIANGEVKPRGGENKLAVTALLEGRGDADPAALAATRKHIGMLKTALGQIRNAFALHGTSAGLENLPALVAKIQGFVDPAATETGRSAQGSAETGAPSDAAGARSDDRLLNAAAAPTSLAAAREALAAIADYYSRREPSSPTLPLVRQAHQLIGKSFLEVISILVPSHLDKAVFQIGSDQVFELPIGKLNNLPQVNAADSTAPGAPADAAVPHYEVQSRSQAIALLEQVQSYFRQSEPASPVPMICERARALAERDFMAVLRDVLPKAALKNIGADK